MDYYTQKDEKGKLTLYAIAQLTDIDGNTVNVMQRTRTSDPVQIQQMRTQVQAQLDELDGQLSAINGQVTLDTIKTTIAARQQVLK